MNYVVKEHSKKFFLHKGKAISSLEELFTELQTMTKEQFHHHVNDKKHDFANWIRDVFGDRFLANKVEKARTLEELQKVIFISLFE